MSILVWITIEMEYKIKCLKFILFFTNDRQKLTAKGLKSTSSHYEFFGLSQYFYKLESNDY